MFLTEHEVINKITFSAVHAVHGLSLPERLSTEPVSSVTLAASEDFARSFQLLLKNSFGNFHAVYSLSRHKYFIKIQSSLLNGMSTACPGFFVRGQDRRLKIEAEGRERECGSWGGAASPLPTS